MIDPSALTLNPPSPQVGALLHYNSFLPEQDPFRYIGSRHWDLEGGAILVGPDRVLTVRHILEKSSRSERAVFLPGHGIFKVKPEPVVLEREDRLAGDHDWLALLRLVRPILGLPPLPFQYVSRRSKGMKSIDLYAWGGWRLAEGSDGTLGGGVQRSITLQPDDPGTHGYSPLDLLWTCPLGKVVQALRDNSGGAVLGRNGGDKQVVVGVIRSADGAKHAASRIGFNRERWLYRQLGRKESVPTAEAAQTDAAETAKPLHLDFQQDVINTTDRRWFNLRLPAHRGSRRAQVTVSATPGLLLQAELSLQPWDDGSLVALSRRHRAVGRFLYRDLDLPDGLGESPAVYLGVAALEEGPELRERVEVQICATFYD